MLVFVMFSPNKRCSTPSTWNWVVTSTFSSVRGVTWQYAIFQIEVSFEEPRAVGTD